jgi:hypothetical protein
MKTLGDYRDICAELGGEKCRAVKYLDDKIAEQGRDMEALADEHQMLLLLGPMLLDDAEADQWTDKSP